MQFAVTSHPIVDGWWVARQTGTPIIVWKDGGVKKIDPRLRTRKRTAEDNGQETTSER